MSPYNGQSVTTTGIVTALYSGSGTVQGFFIEDPECDGDPLTSDGLFVYLPNTTGLSVGQRVSVTAVVQEYQTLTELYAVENGVVIGSGTVTPTDMSLPIASLSDWERYEGMLLRFPQMLAVMDNDTWAQYGELSLSPGRLWQPTHANDPNDADPDGTSFSGANNVGVIDAAASENARSSILLDDGRVDSYPDPPPLMGPEGTLRCGSTVTDLTGVLHFQYGAYRLQPVGTVPLVHDPRPGPPDVGGDPRIASLNVHNYWSTLGGFGASTSGELERQRTKLTAAFFAMDADAYVLCEVQNNDVAWVELIDALNALYGGTEYMGIEADESFGTKSVIFYRPSTLTPTTPLYWIYTNTFERAHITQGFEVNTTGGRFLLSSVHLRSKLCDNADGPDLDQGDGQGCYNAHRRDQSAELATHWATLRASTGIGTQLIVGDFNSYFQEDPVDLLRADGLTTLVPNDNANYSFRYAGVFGALDHALATSTMLDAITGAEPWAINADEPPALDYPDANLAFYQPDAFRCSDHDPVLVGIDASALATAVHEVVPPAGVRFSFDATTRIARWEAEDPITVELLDALGRWIAAPGTPQGSIRVFDLSALTAGAYCWRCSATTKPGFASGRLVIP